MIYIDTPMTNDRVVIIDGNPWVNAPFARSLEHKLNAANHRIKRLEAVVNDPHALWTNWLRGDVKLPVGIGDVRQYQDCIKRLEEAGDKLHWAWMNPFDPAGETIVDNWDKAKEDKL